jgi:pimeloyl-ACP methyl ester carboxylesterase
MTDQPVLLFLHGVGDGDQDDEWKSQLTRGLTAVGYPGLADVEIIAPKYAHALRGWDVRVDLPSVTVKQLARDAARRNRRDFERRMGAVEFRFGRHDGGLDIPGVDPAFAAVLRHRRFEQAHNYANDPQIRAQVLDLILQQVPRTGDLVIVGHSLGSVIAADLLRRLPAAVRVTGLITIGSPLAHGSVDVDKLSDALREPPSNLGWWLNFWNVGDPVSAHRGVSSVFPWMIDFRISTKQFGEPAHAAAAYLAHESVAAAVGFALLGSLTTELVRVDSDVDVVMDASEEFALLALRYAYLTAQQLEGDLRDRYFGAYRLVQAEAVKQLSRRRAEEKRPLPFSIARLTFDVTDPDATVPEPFPSRRVSKDEAVVLTVVLATENVIRPFEIGVPKDKRQAGLEDLTAEMGLTSRYGADVFAAAKEAQDVLTGARNVNWLKWGAVGAGAAAIIAATGGLALVAAPGLVGGAVVTSALAAFGPGGMIGGLLTAGTLVTAGGGGIAFGLASPGTAAEAVESIVQTRLAATILRARQDLEPDPSVWSVLTETEIEVRREYERVDEFSDESAVTLKELARKITTVERALKYLTEKGLEPGTAQTATTSMG